MIKINEKYFFQSDSECLTLFEKKVVKSGKTEGKEKMQAVAYFNPGRYDLLFIRVSEIGTAGLKRLSEISNYYKELKNDINKLLKPGNVKEIREFFKKARERAVRLDSEGSIYENGIRAPFQSVTVHSKPLFDISLKKWHSICTRVKRRDLFTCQRCGNKMSSKLSVHHILSRKEGGTDEERNLVTLCVDCHDFIELNEIVNWDEIKGKDLKYA